MTSPIPLLLLLLLPLALCSSSHTRLVAADYSHKDNSKNLELQVPTDAKTSAKTTSCSHFSTCGACVTSYDCGWCSSSATCVNGNIFGPSSNACPSANFYYFGCPPQTCSQITDCSECVATPDCGYCKTSGSSGCRNGTISGPVSTVASCVAEDWEYISSASCYVSSGIGCDCSGRSQVTTSCEGEATGDWCDANGENFCCSEECCKPLKVKVNGGAIAGIVIAIVVSIGGCVVCCCFCCSGCPGHKKMHPKATAQATTQHIEIPVIHTNVPVTGVYSPKG